jgi:hypothetical protein
VRCCSAGPSVSNGVVRDRLLEPGHWASFWGNCWNGGYWSEMGEVVKVDAECELGSRSGGVEVFRHSVEIPPQDAVATVGFIFGSG